jgi:hypothetical protein
MAEVANELRKIAEQVQEMERRLDARPDQWDIPCRVRLIMPRLNRGLLYEIDVTEHTLPKRSAFQGWLMDNTRDWLDEATFADNVALEAWLYDANRERCDTWTLEGVFDIGNNETSTDPIGLLEVI